jgi:hypothetical protein
MQLVHSLTFLDLASGELESLGFNFLDIGCYERRADGRTVQLGTNAEGVTIRPLSSVTMEPIAPSYLCETPKEFQQALLLLGVIVA